jgi:hypothetical protein
MKTAEEGLAALIEDREFRGVHQKLRRFNLFDAIGAVSGELKHSNFLSFILSPTRSHGMGGELLRQFIRTAVVKLTNEQRPIRALELMTADLDNAIIHRERDNIDLLIELKHLKLIVLVENKIYAAVSDGQLARYKKIVEANYPTFKHLFILLTPEGIEADEDGYVSLSYSEVADLVERIASDDGIPVASELTLILRHYVEMLRRHIVQDEQLVTLARQIYERHKEALDFIIEHRPQPDSLLGAIKRLLDGDPMVVEDRHAPLIIRFAPKEWATVKSFNACSITEWTRTGRNLLFEVKANRETDRVSIALVSGPGDSALRENIYAFCSQRPKIFVNLVKPMGTKYATVFIRDLLSAKAAQNMDAEEKHIVIEAAWKEFLSKDLPALKAELTALADH